MNISGAHVSWAWDGEGKHVLRGLQTTRVPLVQAGRIACQPQGHLHEQRLQDPQGTTFRWRAHEVYRDTGSWFSTGAWTDFTCFWDEELVLNLKNILGFGAWWLNPVICYPIKTNLLNIEQLPEVLSTLIRFTELHLISRSWETSSWVTCLHSMGFVWLSPFYS